ncbi:MAG: ABC transporter permease [Bacteroidia bacterium]|jgi:lipopolysaccharide transport system permease protein
MVHSEQKTSWSLVIKPKGGLFDFNLKELWASRDLLFLLVRRDIVTVYKQTLLGFFWFIIPPVLNALTYLVIFGLFAKVETGADNIVLFYLIGVIAWSYFSDCINRTATTFRANASVFGKVYFPRLIVPLSSVISALIKFLVQLAFLIAVIAWFAVSGNAPNIQWNLIAVLPILLLIMMFTGMSFGLIISSLTTKYRDLSNIVPFAVQFLMYATPVIYPASFFPEKWQWIFNWNPISPLIEIFRYVLLGTDRFNLMYLGYSIAFSILCFIVGLMLFSRTERNFMDTV